MKELRPWQSPQTYCCGKKKKIQEVLELIGGLGHDHGCVIVEAIHMIKESKSSDYLDCNNFSYHSEFASWESSPLEFLL